MIWKMDKSVALVEIPSAVVFGIHKQTNTSGMVSNENSTVNSFSKQEFSVSCALVPERHCEASKPYSRKLVIGIHVGVRRRKMICCNLTKRKSEETQDGGWFVILNKYEGAGYSFFSMLPGRGSEKGVKFSNTAIKTGAVLLTRERRYFEHKSFFLC